MDARRRLLGDALDRFGEVREPALRLLAEGLLQEGEQDLLLLALGLVQERRVALFGPQAEMDEERRVAAVVEDHVGHPAGRTVPVPLEEFAGVVPIVGERLALDGEDGNAGGRDGGSRVILGRVDIARHPADIGAERLQGLDQDAGLDRHVERARDAGALERLARAVFLPHRHQTWHLGLGQRQFLAAPVGESDVGDDVVTLRLGLPHRLRHHSHIPATAMAGL